MFDRLIADLNGAIVARDGTRAQVLRKVLAACRSKSMDKGLPAHLGPSEPDILEVFQDMAKDWEEEACRWDQQGLLEQASARRAEAAVLASYMKDFADSGREDAEDAQYRLRRHSPRLNLGAEFTLKFFLMGEAFEGIRVINLGGGGCRLELDPELAELLEKGSRLHNLAFCHPDLPSTPVLAEVAYLLGKRPLVRDSRIKGAKVLAGLKFIHPPPEFEAALGAYVEARFRAEGEPHPPSWQERIPRLAIEGTEAVEPGLGPGYSANFYLMDVVFPEVPLVNLGAGGCCLLLNPELAELLKAGTRLHNFSLHHPALPAAPQHAQVVYVHEDEPESGARRVTAGVQFLHPKLEFQMELSDFVRNKLHSKSQGA